ncbi:hypothetical protein [Chitinophaga pinensis]|uniref:hypothetical protein n=1 Tax=Chitinophaga pinensis TaxID=79329 RepID=UPI001C993AD6|nr:hypothetical protein [Chitinophaga pinensis]
MNNGREVLMYTSSFFYDPEDKVVFSETEEKRKRATYYTVEKINDHKARLTIDYYLHKNPINEFVFKLTEKQHSKRICESRWTILYPLSWR